MMDAGIKPRAAPSGRSKKTSEESIYAAIDLGTNNCRLLVAAIEKAPLTGDGQFVAPPLRVVDSFSRIVRLGEGVSTTGKLSQEAMDRTIAALKLCQKKLLRHPLTGARFVATEACRKANNSADFIRRVQDETGLELDIITSEEEARLAFLGCSSLLTQTSHRAVVFDIGGGSTELMWIDIANANDGEGTRHIRSIADWLSIDCGVMNLADRFGGHSFADLAYHDMVRYVEKRLEPFDDANAISDSISSAPVQMLSTSGTVTTLAAIFLNLPRYDRSRIDGLKLKISEVRSAIDKLLAMRPSERFNHPCVGPDRADFILSGCAIFDAISNVWPIGDITIADRGVREGIIISLLQDHG